MSSNLVKKVRFVCGCDEPYLSTSSAYERALTRQREGAKCSLCTTETPQFGGGQARLALNPFKHTYRHFPTQNDFNGRIWER